MKILVIGNETPNTDLRTTVLARQNKSINNGLISNIDSIGIIDAGYYHTSVADLSPGQIVQLAEKFDLVKLLDQPKESYPHYKSFVTTLRLFCDMESEGLNVEFRQNKSSVQFLWWRDYLKTNKAICFYPFLALINDTEYTNICPQGNRVPIKKAENIINWQTDEDYLVLRKKMLAGELNPTHCYECYDREAVGEESTRQFETLEWVSRLNIDAPQDLLKFESPIYYEVRPSNICNIMCRTCDDHHSHLIEREWKKINIPLLPHKLQNKDFGNINFNSLEKIYVGGGEATIMPEFYSFLRKCIDQNKTNFELYIGTNGMKISETLLSLLDHFKHVCFSFSFDGYKKVNDYIRWGSDFDTIVTNSQRVRERGFKVALQTVFSTFSISRMHEVFQFYDQEYPDSGLLVQVGLGQNDIFMPFNHPCPELVIESMRLCQETNMYYQNGRSIKSMVDLILAHYSSPSYNCNIDKLQEFYQFNGKLDQARNSNLADYIPELAEARKLYNI
jgi:hypothetical protein